MTHRDKSAVRGLIEELLGTDLGEANHGDAMRRLLAAALQDLVDAEATARIGAARYERSGERITHRNGVRAKQLATRPGRSSSLFRSCARARSSPACWSRAGGSTRPCGR